MWDIVFRRKRVRSNVLPTADKSNILIKLRAVSVEYCFP